MNDKKKVSFEEFVRKYRLIQMKLDRDKIYIPKYNEDKGEK